MHCPNATQDERQEARKTWATRYMKKQKTANVKLTTIKVYSSQQEAEADGVKVNESLKGPTATSITKFDEEPHGVVYLHWTNGANKVTKIMTFDPASQVHVFNDATNLTNVKPCKPIHSIIQ